MSRRAFTIIELLVVIAIIGMLTALLFPVFAMVRKRTIHTTCLSNLHQLGVATQQYMGDNDNNLPPFNPYHWAYSPPGTPMNLMPQPLTRYGVTDAIGKCPTSKDPFSMVGYTWRYVLYGLGPGDWSATRDRAYRIQPEPGSVLAVCARHLEKGLTVKPGLQTYTYNPLKRSGNYIVLRADGAVEQIPAAQVKVWHYTWKNGQGIWLPPDSSKTRGISTSFDVFPNEPWPPRLLPEPVISGH